MTGNRTWPEDATQKTSAVLLVDVINSFDFEGAHTWIRQAELAASSIRELVGRARNASIPIIYVDDNFGKWYGEFKRTYARTIALDSAGRPIAQTLKPLRGDHFVFKPRYSGFSETSLEILLRNLKIRSNNCRICN